MTDGRGCLAIWTRIEAVYLEEYRRWLSNEHIAQRINISGFRSARVFTRDDDGLSHFILYNVDSVALFREASYLGVLNNPTPWTNIMMPRLRDFDRAAGTQIFKAGQGAGAFISVARLGWEPGSTQAADLTSVAGIDGFAALRLYRVDRAGTDLASTEKTMRAGGEGQFTCLLVAEALAEGVSEKICARAADLLGGGPLGPVRSFRQSYMLADNDRQEFQLTI